MAKIELSFDHGEEVYICSECGKKVYEEFINDWQHEDAERCPNCGEIVEDIDVK